jgi:exodeoxyribonuclease VII large subunit
LPVRVQGAEAPGEIVSAIRYANYHKLADLLIVGRGGGSIEDLWAFNDERVAYAIYESKIPIISAVGHEPDVTISDFVADMRAATPSNAAELAVPDQEALTQILDTMLESMSSSLQRQLKNARRNLQTLSASRALQSPDAYLRQRKESLNAMTNRLVAGQSRSVALKRQRFVGLTSKLDAMSPLKVLTRGYAMTQTEDGELLKSVKSVGIGESIRVSLQDGCITAQVSNIKENV